MRRILLAWLFLFTAAANAQTSLGANIQSGVGSPVTLGVPCVSGMNAGPNSSMLYDDASVTTGNTIWKCRPAGWTAPYLSPFAASGVTAVITPPTLVGCTSGTATVAGATTAMGAMAAAIGSPGTGQINTTAYVSAANTVTVTLCLPLSLVYTANPVAYKVLVF